MFKSNSIFWIDIEKIKPNPYQPRREFDEEKLRDLADSIRQYGILQPLVVSRLEIEKEDGGLIAEYELVAGERRLRAAKIAELLHVPAVIREGDSPLTKLEMAIIENLQREDLNPIDRARAFMRLNEEFSFTHAQIGRKIGKSREYVSNSLRLLSMPEEFLQALSEGKIHEGHTRPIMMLSDRPEEQRTLFKEILYRKISVRESEQIARKIAYDRVRKKEYLPDPEIAEIENKLSEALGTRVEVEKREVGGGHVMIHFFSNEDLRIILDLLKSNQERKPTEMLDRFIAGSDLVEGEASDRQIEGQPNSQIESIATVLKSSSSVSFPNFEEITPPPAKGEVGKGSILDALDDKNNQDDDLYNIKNFSI